MFYWNSLPFSMIQWMLAICSLILLPFLNPAWTSGNMVHVLLKLHLENFEHYFASVWDECKCVIIWTFFGIAFLWGWNENWPFPVLWPLLSFPNLLAYWIQERKEASKERKSKDTLILDLQPPNLWENKCLLLKSPSSWYFVMEALAN